HRTPADTTPGPPTRNPADVRPAPRRRARRPAGGPRRPARVRLGRASRIGLHGAEPLDASTAIAEVRLPRVREARKLGGVERLPADPEVLDVDAARAGRLVEEVVAVPVIGLGPHPLDDR